MLPKPKTYSFIDVLKFAAPSINNIDVVQTAEKIKNRDSKAFMSYGTIYARLPHIVQNPVSEEYLEENFNFYKHEWKNKCLRQVAQMLSDYFGGRGTWFKGSRKRISVLDTMFHPSQQGLWLSDGQLYNVLINPRKGQPIKVGEERFLARAMYELHGIDNPNNPDQLIIDLSAKNGSQERQLRSYFSTEATAISLSEFEDIMRLFFEALDLAGITRHFEPGTSPRDMFRRR